MVTTTPDALLRLKIATIITDFFEDRPDSLADMYDARLNISLGGK